jgi:hypothetical protein
MAVSNMLLQSHYLKCGFWNMFRKHSKIPPGPASGNCLLNALFAKRQQLPRRVRFLASVPTGCQRHPIGKINLGLLSRNSRICYPKTFQITSRNIPGFLPEILWISVIGMFTCNLPGLFPVIFQDTSGTQFA